MTIPGANKTKWVCPICGMDSNRLSGVDTMTVKDAEGNRWHRSCVVALLPALLKLLKSRGLKTHEVLGEGS